MFRQASAGRHSHPSLSATRRRCSRGALSPRSMTGLRSGCVLTPIVPPAIRLGAASMLGSAIQRLLTESTHVTARRPGGSARASRNCSAEKSLGATSIQESDEHPQAVTGAVRVRVPRASSRGACASRRMVDRRGEKIFWDVLFRRGSGGRKPPSATSMRREKPHRRLREVATQSDTATGP
jgi:hypothetical protein